MGEKGEMMKAEKEQLMDIENQAEQQPPSKKKKTELSSKRGKGRKPLVHVHYYYVIPLDQIKEKSSR